MGKSFILGGKSTIFWDPAQPDPENQVLLINEVKELEDTQSVQQWKRSGGIVELNDADAKDYAKKFGADTKKASANAKADAKLEQAAALEQKGNEALAEAKVKHEAAEAILSENDLLKKQLQEAQAKLDAATKK